MLYTYLLIYLLLHLLTSMRGPPPPWRGCARPYCACAGLLVCPGGCSQTESQPLKANAKVTHLLCWEVSLSNKSWLTRMLTDFFFKRAASALEDDQTQGGTHLPRTMSDGCVKPGSVAAQVACASKL